MSIEINKYVDVCFKFKAELKRLYTSLHVLKTKTLRNENPHLNKRQGQRKKNRRFSMQAFQRHTTGHTTSHVTSGASGTTSHALNAAAERHDRDSTKTPEDSTGSLKKQQGFTL